jgi:hypothetical protein
MTAQPSRSTDGAPIPRESTRRILEVLREALREELRKTQRTPGTQTATLDSAWSMLAADCAGWKVPAHLDARLYERMRRQFSDDVTREVLLAAAGVKLSRTCLSDARLEVLQEIADEHKFSVLASEGRYVHRQDTAKGGASNRIEGLAEPGDAAGLRNVYVAADASVVEAGRLLEEAGDDEIFGTLLGIPACCREAYVRFKPRAIEKQNDFVPLVLDNTPGPMPYDPWLNYVARYFGRALLSFFPCSFRCPAAGLVARASFGMLSRCDGAWAQSFLDLQQANVLYTEYEGLHLFRRPFANGSIQYGVDDVDSTEATKVTDLIRRGDRLAVRDARRVDVYRQADRIGVVEGEDVGMCVFW